MKIDIHLVPTAPIASSLSHHVVVVIDVLRASSVIVQAISQGVTEVIPVTTVEEAFQKAKTFRPGTTLLGGERGSRKIEGFDLGNSPREYRSETVSGKRLILTTTNGTKAFSTVSSAQSVLVGSFFNISAVAGRCLDLAQNVLIYPAGDEGRFSLEDTVCGGMLIDLMTKKGGGPFVLSDAARSAHILFERFEEDLVRSFYLSQHGRDLVERGFEEDLSYCAQVDRTDIVPIFQDGVIR